MQVAQGSVHPHAVTAPASVISSNGDVFTAQVAEIQPTRLRLQALTKELAFRERVVVEFFGVSVHGEVVFSSNREAGVVFETTPEIFVAIEAFEDYVHEHGEDPVEPVGDQGDRPNEQPSEQPSEQDWQEPTVHENRTPLATIDLPLRVPGWDAVPRIDAEGRVEAKSDLDRLAMLLTLKAARPLWVRGDSDQAVSRAFLEGGDGPLELVAIPAGSGAYILHPPSRSDLLDQAILRCRKALDDVNAATLPIVTAPAGPKFDPEDLPILRPDGIVQFKSHLQFVAQHAQNLSTGAIMVRGAAQNRGDRMRLVLSIPAAEALVVDAAEVVFIDGGKVGFSVPNRQAFVDELKVRLTPSATAPAVQVASPAAPAGLQRPAAPPLQLNGRLTGMPRAQGFIELRDGPPTKLTSAGGWYIGLLDRLFRSGQDALIKVDHRNEQIKIWIHDRRAVAVDREPPPPKDRLGERLLASRAVDRAALNRALEEAKKNRKPVGQLILESSAVTRVDLHRALRAQMMDRIMAPAEWTSGRFEVGGWSDPPIDADLLPVTGDAVVAQLLRKQLKQTLLADLRTQLQSYMYAPASIDLAQISESFRLTEREQRYFQRAAEISGTLPDLMAAGQARPLEGYRLILLGAALGIVKLRRSST